MADRIQSVLIVMAMEAEAAPIIEQLSLVKDTPKLIDTPTDMETYSGQVGNIKVHVAHNGKCSKFDVDKVGTNAATLTTYLAIQTFKPTLVISSGTAGGFKAQGADIASIFVSTATVNHDRRIPIPGFDAFGVGREDSFDCSRMAEALGFKQGVVSTGNSLDYTDECMARMVKEAAAVKDMESAAVAYVCRLWRTPMFAIKSVTDIVDGDRAAQEEFLENLGKAAAALREALVKVLDYMQDKALAHL